MTYSLVLATIERTEAVDAFLASVQRTPEAGAAQVEVIVVDQNGDDRLAPVLRKHEASFQIRHVRSAAGISRARNLGLRSAKGDVIAFPDDDCLYRPDTLSNVSSAFARTPACQGLSGLVRTPAGDPFDLRWPREAERLSKRRIWFQALSVSVFLRRAVVEAVGGFDESLGVGAGTAWGSGEETDYLLRALQAGFDLRFDPAIEVLHPASRGQFNHVQRRRAYSYALGMGRVLSKHRFPLRDRFWFALRPALGCLLSGARGRFDRAGYYANVTSGRLRGMLSHV